MEEARRIKQLAEATHPKGARLIATFRNSYSTREIAYHTPQDIPPQLQGGFLLYSVATEEQFEDRREREKALERQKLTAKKAREGYQW